MVSSELFGELPSVFWCTCSVSGVLSPLHESGFRPYCAVLGSYLTDRLNVTYTNAPSKRHEGSSTPCSWQASMICLAPDSHLWETLLKTHPVNQRFISPPSGISNIRSRDALHRIVSLCSAKAIGITIVVAYKFSHLSFTKKTISWSSLLSFFDVLTFPHPGKPPLK